MPEGRIPSTHSHWTFLHIVGVRKLGYVGEQGGAIQGPGVFATGNLQVRPKGSWAGSVIIRPP